MFSPSGEKGDFMESITFMSPFVKLQLHIAPEKKSYEGEVLKVEPAKIIAFEEGQYTTSVESEIEAIKSSMAFRQGKIFELTDKDKMAVLTKPERPVAHRGVLTTQHISKEAGGEITEPQERGMATLGEMIKCPHCEVMLPRFPANKMKGHIMGAHRRKTRLTEEEKAK
jgi:hypothetical protein